MARAWQLAYVGSLLTLLGGIQSQAAAQCQPRWLEGAGVPGVNGVIYATATWDPDGPGPRTPLIVVGGNFDLAGKVLDNSLAGFDPASGTWVSLGLGLQSANTVHAVSVLPDGSLVVGGDFRRVGPEQLKYIARWNGTSWTALGTGIDGPVFALANSSNNSLVAGGAFATAGGVPANNIAQWNGTQWSSLGAGTSGPTDFENVFAISALPSGGIVVGGIFTFAGNVEANGVATWDGSTWAPLGSGLSGESRFAAALLPMPDGSIVVGGRFTSAGGIAANSIARWDGAQWHQMDSGVSNGFFGRNAQVNGLAARSDGRVIATGYFAEAGGIGANAIAQWNGSHWSSFHFPIEAGRYAEPVVYTATELESGSVLIAGDFTCPVDRGAQAVALWNGQQASSLGTGTGGTTFPNISTVTELPNGDIVVTGAFRSIEGTRANGIARWDGFRWNPLGQGLSTPNYGYVSDVVVLHNGDLVVGGSIGVPGWEYGQWLARWNGTSWVQFPAVPDGLRYVEALAVLHNGDLVMAGLFDGVNGTPARNIARWDGAAWHPLGEGVVGWVASLHVRPDGTLIVGGSITQAGSIPVKGVARWNGSEWSAIGQGFEGNTSTATVYVDALDTLPNGDLIAAGRFRYADGVEVNNIARWDGSSWSALGAGLSPGRRVAAVVHLSDGSIVAGGDFYSAGELYTGSIARWDGTEWTSFGDGLRSGVSALRVLRNGDLMAGGGFTRADGRASVGLATWSSPCNCPADLDSDGLLSTGFARDGAVTIDDLLIFLYCFDIALPAIDLDDDGDPSIGNADGIVSVADLLYFLAHFEIGC